ncbi:MAG: hypothetical protein KAS84_06550 [Anaerolineales bacterium]|nr:hypothetical protein [Anaerolineales bacterium]
MSKKALLKFLISLLILLFLSSCVCDAGEIAVFEVLKDSPADGDLVSSLLPTFNWHHNESCDPDYYHLYIKENGPYLPGININTSDDDTSHTITGTPLQPAKEYTWMIQANVNMVGSGPFTDTSIFYTGPVCSGSTLVAPELEVPGNSAWIDHNNLQEFNWTYPGDCLPTSYSYQFASDPGFTNILTSGTTPLYQQYLFETFPSCSTVFWRVAARDGSTVGPWSEVFDFHWVRFFDDCPQTHFLSINTAQITGQVFHDVCPQTSSLMPFNQILSVSCTTTSGFGIHGNGVRDPWDEPLKATINLGSGACPSTGLDSQITGFWGTYEFIVQTPGEYCLSINKQQTAIDSFTSDPLNLNQGLWTLPLTHDSIAEHTLVFSEGFSSIVHDFGWDDSNQPELRIEQQSFCRRWPRIDDCGLAILEEGQILPVIARNEAGTWVQVLIGDIECFTSLVNGKLKDPLSLDILPVVPDSALPVPEPCPPEAEDLTKKSCSDFKTRATCPPRCKWVPGAAAPGYCTNQ